MRHLLVVASRVDSGRSRNKGGRLAYNSLPFYLREFCDEERAKYLGVRPSILLLLLPMHHYQSDVSNIYRNAHIFQEDVVIIWRWRAGFERPIHKDPRSVFDCQAADRAQHVFSLGVIVIESEGTLDTVLNRLPHLRL